MKRQKKQHQKRENEKMKVVLHGRETHHQVIQIHGRFWGWIVRKYKKHCYVLFLKHM